MPEDAPPPSDLPPARPPEAQRSPLVVRIYGVGCLLSFLGLAGMIFLGPFGGSAVAGGVMAGGLAILCGLGLAAIAITVFRIYFAWAQIRTLELLVIVAVTGNTVGALIGFSNTYLLPQDRWLAPVFAAVGFVFAIGGGAYGLYLVQCLGSDRTFSRLRVLACGWLMPLALYGVTLGWMHALTLPRLGAGNAVLALVVFVVSLVVMLSIWDLHLRAREAYLRMLSGFSKEPH